MSVTSFLSSLLLVVLLSFPVLTISLPSPPPLETGDDASLSSLLSYWARADNAYGTNNAPLLLSASAQLFTLMTSPSVDKIAAASSPAILNFRSFYDYWAPYKKYIVGRGFELAATVDTADFVAFLAAAMDDYSTLDQVTVQAVLATMQQLMGNGISSGALWNATDSFVNGTAPAPATRIDATYVLQQCYHATSLAQAELSNVSISQSKPPQSASTAKPYTFSASTVLPSELFNLTDAALKTLLAHAVANIHPYPWIGSQLGSTSLSYNRSLTAAVARVELPLVNDSFLSIQTPYDFSTMLTITPAAYPKVSANSTLYVEMAQVDGWGDRISFDIFPTVLVSLSSGSSPLTVDPSYNDRSVILTFAYSQQNCNDGWVNSGRFRFSAGGSNSSCLLSCAKYVNSLETFSNAPQYVTMGVWDTLANTIQCYVDTPGYYTVLKENVPVPVPATDRTDGIVTVRATLKDVPAALLFNMTQLMQLAADDVTYLLDVPPTRIIMQSVNESTNGAAGDVNVEFQILGATTTSPLSSLQLFAYFLALDIEDTSHTDRFTYMAPSSTTCVDGCSASNGGNGMSRTEIIAIAVVVGFFGTIIIGVLLALCCVQMKYWYDRHDFRPAQVDEEDTELGGVGAAAEYGGVQSARQRKDESKRRRSTRVSWYNKQDVETAASYTYSRNSRSNSASESGKAPVFRVRSDSHGSVDDDLKLDEVEVVGGVDEVSLDDLAEIGIVMDGVENAEDSYVMDGHKVKAVKQVQEVDAENVDDSRLARSRSASQLSEYSQNSQSHASDNGHENSVNSRNSSNSVSAAGEAPLSMQYPARDDEPTTPRTPRTPGGGKRAFYYKE